MVETLTVAGIILMLLFVATGGAFMQWSVLLGVGAAAAALGLTFGVAVGIGYHVALYRALAPLHLLGPRWWWRPTSYHSRLPPAGRRTVMPWFYAGAASVMVALAGCALIFAGILAM